ncbi:hypothetical protein PRIPAC_77750 [Pristionchus pacificus]|uniref:Uncharacterized protein n=1 Tax=Pristionchus pacificus TaxID=54126 RepID=A0A2A6CQY9_PRIPA|nr:hypothetical protein PRIPAC_77750 [Pristionchus pacificus]|eukprot:PDM80441.1 hypothetical protein PRIPAC_33020 [Pristionchus pacificus]
MSALFYLILLTLSAVTAEGAPEACEGCQCCSQDLITISTSGSRAHAFDSDVTDTSEHCALRTFTCKGEFAKIEINEEGGVVDGGTEVTFAVTEV